MAISNTMFPIAPWKLSVPDRGAGRYFRGARSDCKSKPSLPSRIAVIGNYLPRHCGIATFTTDLCERYFLRVRNGSTDGASRK